MKRYKLIAAILTGFAALIASAAVVDAATNPPITCASDSDCKTIGSAGETPMEVWFPSADPSASTGIMTILIDYQDRVENDEPWVTPTVNDGCALHPEISLPCQTGEGQVSIYLQWETDVPGVWDWELIYNPALLGDPIQNGVTTSPLGSGFPTWTTSCTNSCRIFGPGNLTCEVQRTVCNIERPKAGSGSDVPPGWPANGTGPMGDFTFGVGVQPIGYGPGNDDDTSYNGIVVSRGYVTQP